MLAMRGRAMNKIIQVLFPTRRKQEPETWCKCRIIEPRIWQKGDTLYCEFCNEVKQLPAKIDLKWEISMRKFIGQGQAYYTMLSRDELIKLLLERDRNSFNFFRRVNHLHYCHLDDLLDFFADAIKYVRWKHPSKKP
jgi:hypothetical protein